MIAGIIRSLRQISHPRFLQTERGFQGELAALLRGELGGDVWPGDAIVEQEYQKRALAHGLTSRPDIIIHRPADEGGNPGVGNYVVVEIKRRGTLSQAKNDFVKLDRLVEKLRYRVAVFININTTRTHAQAYSGKFPSRMHFFAVRWAAGRMEIVHQHFSRGSLRTTPT